MSVLTSPQLLSDEQLEELFDACNLPEIGRKEVRRIRSSDPVRREYSYGNNVCTRFPSRKMGMTLHTASRNCELVAAVSWEHDPDVHEMWDRPGLLQLVYKRNGRTVHAETPPDFFLVHAKPPHFRYIECKLDSDIPKLLKERPERWAQDPEFGMRCPPVERALAPTGLAYQVWTPGRVNLSRQRNIRFLADFLGEAVSDDDRERVLGLVNEQPGISVEDTLDKVGDANPIYALIASGELHFDPEKYDLRKPELVPLFPDARTLRTWEAALASRRSVPDPGDLDGLERGQKLSALAKAALGSAGPAAIDEAMERLGVIRDVVDGKCSAKDVAKGGKHAKTRKRRKARRTKKRAGEVRHHQVPLGTVYIWLQAYRKAEHDLGCGLVGLIPDWQNSGRRGRRFEESVYVAMDSVAAKKYETADAPSVKASYKYFRKEMRAQGVPLIPCEKTFRQYLKSRKRDRQIGKREGRRARIAQALWLDDSSEVFAKEGCRPGDVVHIDHTQLDIFIVVRDRFGKKTVLHLRPWLTLAICAWSRKALGHALSLDHPSADACMEVLRDILRRDVAASGEKTGRLPAGIVVDFGSEFFSTTVETSCACYVIEKVERPASKPRFGAVIERLFGTVNTRRIHDLPGNSKHHKNARKMSREVDARRRAELSLEDLEAELEEFLYGEYNGTTHSSLGMSPDDKYAEGVRKFGHPASRQVAYDADFLFQTMVFAKREKAKVSRPGMIQVENVRYVHDVLREDGVMGTKVPVKVDSDDAGYVVVWIDKLNEWIVCEARNQYRVFSGCSRRVLRIARKIVLAEANGNPVDEDKWIASIERLSSDRRIRLQKMREEARHVARAGASRASQVPARCELDATETGSRDSNGSADTFDPSWSGVGRPVEFKL